MAPEQAIGDVATDYRADLYALGLILYEMLTGGHPFSGRTARALARAHLTERPAPPGQRRRDTPPVLNDMVLSLLAKEPSERPGSAQEVLHALSSLESTPSIRHRRSREARVAGVLAVVLTLFAAGYLSLRLLGGREGATPTAIRTVAVLPFANLSGSQDDEYFSDGLTDELAHALMRVPGLRIAGRTSSYAFKDRPVAAPEIGRALDVGAIITGSVRRNGERLRITTQLISTADGTVLRDSAFENTSNDVFAVQDALTAAIVTAFAPELGGGGGQTVVFDVRRGTANEEAYQLYLKGRYYWQQRGVQNLDRSITYFRQAIALDSSFARAYAGLSMAYFVLPNFVPDPGDTLAGLQRSSAERAITLDSADADAQLAAGAALEVRSLKFLDAQDRYRAAIRLEPANATAHHWLGMNLLNVGQTDEAITELQRATSADPLMPSPASALSASLFFARRFDEAETAAQRALAIDSTFNYAYLNLGQAQEFNGHPDSAIVTLEHGLRLHPDDSRLRGSLLLAYAFAGRWADASRVRDELRRPGGDSFDGMQVPFADLVFGDPGPLVRQMTSEAAFRRFQLAGGVVGCNPLYDPLWSDAWFRSRMRSWQIQACPLARPWPLARRGQAG